MLLKLMLIILLIFFMFKLVLSRKNLKKSSIYILGTYINPIIGTPSVWKSFHDFNYCNPLAISLLIGVLGMGFIPNESNDLFRHYLYFENFNIDTFNLFEEKYFGFSILVYLVKKVGLSKEVLTFISLSLFFFMLIKLLKKIYELNGSKKKKYWRLSLLFVLMVTGVPHLYVYSGIRFFLGMMFIVYGLLDRYYFKASRIKMIMLYVVGISLHKALIFSIVIFFFDLFFKWNKKSELKVRGTIYVLIVLVSLLINYRELSLKILSLLNISARYALNETVYGFGGFFKLYKISTGCGLVKLFFEHILYLFFPYYYLSKFKVNDRVGNLMITSSYAILLVFPHYDFFRRYTYILYLLVVLNMVKNIKKSRKIPKYMLILLGLKSMLLLIFLITNYKFVFTGIISNIYKITILTFLGTTF